MSSYSSQFFVPSPVASGQKNTKATVGLGFDLPADVLAYTSRAAPMAGLGIFIDSCLESDESTIVTSPPMLAPRRSPPRFQIADSPATESAPLQTPSPSMRGLTSVMPPTPSLKCSPVFPRAVGLGIDVLGLDALELALSFQESACYPAATGVGLGFNLPHLTDAELITALEPQSTSQHGVPVDLSFVEDGADEGPGRSSPLQSMPSRPFVGLGINLTDVGIVSPTPRTPTLGFDSPFWTQYASAMQES